MEGMNVLDANDLILERLTELGCDVSGALPRFLGKREFYCRLLAQVPEEENFESLGAALAAGDAKAAFERAHALKGVLGNMGLTPMYDEACAIVGSLGGGRRGGAQDAY